MYRRTVDELIARYELEPELKDVYVEGSFDCELLHSHFRAPEYNGITFYEVDTVHIPADAIIAQGLTEGQKQRLIVMARALSKLTRSKCRFIVDRDLDHWLDITEDTNRLVWTRYTSIDAYYFSDAFAHEFLIRTAKCKISSLREYMDSLASTLSVLYAMRLADASLCLSLSWISIDKCLSRRDNRIIFDRDEYSRRLLNANGHGKRLDEFAKSTRAWERKFSGDCRHFIRGHDFVYLLAYTVNKFGGVAEFSSTTAIERILILVAPSISDLSELLDNDVHSVEETNQPQAAVAD